MSVLRTVEDVHQYLLNKYRQCIDNFYESASRAKGAEHYPIDDETPKSDLIKEINNPSPVVRELVRLRLQDLSIYGEEARDYGAEIVDSEDINTTYEAAQLFMCYDLLKSIGDKEASQAAIRWAGILNGN